MKIHNKIPVLISVAVLLIASAAKPAAMKVFSSFAEAERKLPIYCVETDENKVAPPHSESCAGDRCVQSSCWQ